MLVVVRVVSLVLLVRFVFYGRMDDMSMHLGSVGAPFCHILGVLGTPGAHFGLILGPF